MKSFYFFKESNDWCKTNTDIEGLTRIDCESGQSLNDVFVKDTFENFGFADEENDELGIWKYEKTVDGNYTGKPELISANNIVVKNSTFVEVEIDPDTNEKEYIYNEGNIGSKENPYIIFNVDSFEN